MPFTVPVEWCHDSTDTPMKTHSPDPPDLTDKLKLVRIAATGSLSVVYLCLCAESTKVAVKAVTFPPGFDPTEKNQFILKMRYELGIWESLNHPNIVPLLGTAYGKNFGSDLPCIVSAWMTSGTLNEYLKQRGTRLSLPDRIKLIKGSAAGLEYLHSHGVVHGNVHPGNIVIDDERNALLTDFGFPLSLSPMQDQLSYLWTDSIRPSGPMWAAPEVLYPGSYPKLKFQATCRSDTYSLGSIILFILSGKYPWRDRGEAEYGLKNFQNPPRPVWPVNMPDRVWDFIERCWSPRDPDSRLSAQEVLSFCSNELEQLLQPNLESVVNVVLLGSLGSGKSSIINLLVGQPVAQISPDVEPCTERPTSYQISIGKKLYRLWDTMGFSVAHEGPTDHLLPYEHAHAVLRNLPEGVNMILLCAHKGVITPSIRHLYWLVNDFFYGGRAPIAFVATHLDTPDMGWWERNVQDIARLTGIPIQSLPHVCATTDPAGCDQSKHALEELLRTYATAVPPVPLRPHLSDLSSHASASLDLTTHCGLTSSEATRLVEKFRRPLRPFNVVFFGEPGAGTSEIVNLLAGRPVAETSPEAITYARSYRSNIGMQQFHLWDPMGMNKLRVDHDLYMGVPEKVCQLIRDLSVGDGVDLLVFCKRYQWLAAEELSTYRIFDKTLGKRRLPPVALITTHFDSPHSSEKWWEMNGKELVKSMGGDVIGHACIPPLASHGLDDAKLDRQLAESRSCVEVMLENCVSSLNSRLPLSAKFSPRMIRKTSTARPKRCISNLRDRFVSAGKQATRRLAQWLAYVNVRK